MRNFIGIGVDLARNYFQIHAPPAYPKPDVKRGENAAAGADAIREAMARTRFAPVKSASNRAAPMPHETHMPRGLLIKQRATSVNAPRGHLAEFGVIAAKGIGRADGLIELAESDAPLPGTARAGIKVLARSIVFRNIRNS